MRIVEEGQKAGISEDEMKAQIVEMVRQATGRDYLEYILTGLLENVFSQKNLSGLVVVGFERNMEDGHDYPLKALLIGELEPLDDEQNLELASVAIQRLRERTLSQRGEM